MSKVVFTENAPKALGPYSQAIVVNGFVYCSGQTPIDPATNTLLQGTVQDQTRRCLANLSEVLKAAGSSLDKVFKTNVFLKDMNDFAAMNQAYGEVFGNNKPARSTVEVARLPLDAQVEIECIATL